MKIKAKIYAEGIMGMQSAQMTVMYRFVYEGADASMVRFLLPTPDGAAIYGLQIMDENRCMTRGEILPWSEADCTDSKIRLLQHGENLYELWFEAVPEGELSILVSLICPTEPTENGCRLAIPFSTEGVADAEVIGEAEVCMTVAKPCRELNSPTHAIEREGNSVTMRGDCSEDFVLDAVWESAQTAEISATVGGGILACRLQVKKPEQQHKLLLIPDFGGREASRNLCRQLLYEILQNASGNDISVFLENRVIEASAYDDDGWYQLLSEIGAYAEPPKVSDEVCPGAVRVWICGAGSLAMPPNDDNTVLLTVGGARSLAVVRNRQGHWRHFYPNEQKAITPEMIPLPAAEEIRIQAADGILTESYLNKEHSSVGYVDFFAVFSGRKLTEISVYCAGEAEKVQVEDTKVLPENKLPEQLFAIAKSRELTQLADTVSPESLSSIKQQLEQVGARYGIMNGEMICVFENTQGGKTGIPVLQCSMPVGMANYRTVFGEEKTDISPKEREDVKYEVLQILLGAVRADGAVTDAVEEEERANQTAYAVLALSRYDDLAVGQVVAGAKQYLLTHLPTGYARVLWDNREHLTGFLCNHPIQADMEACRNAAYRSVTSAAWNILSP